MLRLSSRFADIIVAFAPVFVQHSTWCHSRLLLLGALLTLGQRTVSSILQIVRLPRERHFVNYHRMLNRAVWNSPQDARLLLNLLISRFVSTGPIVLGVDDTIVDRVGTLGTLLPHARPGAKKLTDWTRQVALQARRWQPSTRGRLPGARSCLLVTALSPCLTCWPR